MNKEIVIKFRIPLEEKDIFKKIAEENYGGMSRCLRLFVQTVVEEKPYLQDDELFIMSHAVKALRGYTTNVNQLARYANTHRELSDETSLEELKKVVVYVREVMKSWDKMIRLRENQTIRMM